MLTRDEVAAKINSLALDNFGIEDPNTHFSVAGPDYLNYDSLDKMNFIMTLEDHFNIEISEADAYCFDTLKEITNYVFKRIK